MGAGAEETQSAEVSQWIAVGELCETQSWTLLRDGKETLFFDRHGDVHGFLLTDSRLFFWHGTLVYLGQPVRGIDGHLYIHSGDWRETILPLFRLQQDGFYLNPGAHIVLDPGHGGHDEGARSADGKVLEKDLNLTLAFRLGELLVEKGFEVSLTREEDRFIPLAERGQIANEIGADLFLSLHYNGSLNPESKGVEVFTFTPLNQPSTSRQETNESDALPRDGHEHLHHSLQTAWRIQRSMIRETGMTDRGVKRARFVVLRDLKMPGVLIEGGFLTHPDEAEQISSENGIEKLARAILKALLESNPA